MALIPPQAVMLPSVSDDDIGGAPIPDHEQPGRVSGLSDVAAGAASSYALTGQGDAYGFGGNEAGQLGDGTTTERHSPTAIGFSAGSVQQSVSYAYDGGGLRVSTSTGEGTHRFAYSAAQGLPLILSDGQQSFLYGPNGLPVEQINTDGSVQYLHHDQLGSTRLLTDESGKIGGAYSYSPYGKTYAHTGASTPLQGAGQYHDPSGLYYLRARYLDPQTAQFLTPDPLNAVTQSSYNYAGNDPLNRTDPLGLCFGPDVVCNAAGAVASGFSTFGQGVAHGADLIGHAAEEHPSAFVNGAGFVACGAATVFSFGVAAPICIGAGVAAFTANTVQTVRTEGLNSSSGGQILVDAVLTAGTLGIGRLVQRPLRLLAKRAADGGIADALENIFLRSRYLLADSLIAGIGSLRIC
jgi:RHS repeat-associated protein